MKNNRFDYVQYDEQATAIQNQFKVEVQKLESMIEKMGAGRYQSMAMTALEETYCWIGKAIKEHQIMRNGTAPLQEGRKNG